MTPYPEGYPEGHPENSYCNIMSHPHLELLTLSGRLLESTWLRGMDDVVKLEADAGPAWLSGWEPWEVSLKAQAFDEAERLT